VAETPTVYPRLLRYRILMKGSRWLRRFVHGAAALIFVLLAVGLPLHPGLATMGLRLSPVLALGTLGARRMFGLTLMGAAVVVVLALWRRRWFCFHLCPTGFWLEWVGRWHPEAAGRFGRWPRLGFLVLGLLAGSALVGFPILLWTDPLALASSFLGAWRQPMQWLVILPAGGFLVVTILTLWRPHLWCLRLCPLGALQDLLRNLVGIASAREQQTPEPIPAAWALSRRAFLAIGGGALAGRLILRWNSRPGTDSRSFPLRPPGAADELAFPALCARCGACLRICPTRILRPHAELSYPSSLGTAVVHYERPGGFCLPECRACTSVCPTGALRPLRLEEKQALALGEAVVNRSTCLAWKEGAWCLQCKAACPYHAIEQTEYGGIPCPVVRPDRCRGCGACQIICPVEPDPAITVRGKGKQRRLQV